MSSQPSPAGAADPATQAKLQELSTKYQTLQSVLEATVSGRQKLESQLQENETVLAELNRLPDGDADADDGKPPPKVYKRIGPVLLKQDKAEAVMSVNSRLDFIKKEIKRVEDQIQASQKEIEEVKVEIVKIQSEAAPQQPASS